MVYTSFRIVAQQQNGNILDRGFCQEKWHEKISITRKRERKMRRKESFTSAINHHVNFMINSFDRKIYNLEDLGQWYVQDQPIHEQNDVTKQEDVTPAMG